MISKLTDKELMRHAWVNHDPITGTELESELLRRFEAHTDTWEEFESVLKDIEKSDFDVSEVRELLALLEEFHIDSLKDLRQKLERADQWYDLADEAGDLFQRLTTLQQKTI